MLIPLSPTFVCCDAVPLEVVLAPFLCFIGSQDAPFAPTTSLPFPRPTVLNFPGI
jgi:hypothetical protein